jgi:PilX N-terminal
MSRPQALCRIGHAQQGAAALVVTALLFVAMLLAVAFVNRNLLLEQRMSANQARSTIAFEAAEAGLEWAIAQLNNPQRLGADCLPSNDPAATSFRRRYLDYSGDTATFVPATWSQAGATAALRPGCVRSGNGWSCSCPSNGAPLLSPSADATPGAAFTLQFLPAATRGVIRVAAIGCTSIAGACSPGSTIRADASATLEVALGLLPGVRTPPAAAITVRGAFDADSAAVGAHNPDPSAGIAIHAGGPIAAAQAHLTTAAGSPGSAALAGDDTALASLGTDRLFASIFGLDKSAWARQPAVTRIDCSGDCSAAVEAAVQAAADHALIWVDGDLTLAGPLTLGSVQHPVVIVVTGGVRLQGAVALSGLIYSASMRWDDTAGGAVLRGAAISEGNYQGNGAPEFFYDSAVLAALTGRSGSVARVSGSWRDF